MIAVIMCGGMGTRMRPITELIPKPLLQIGGRAVLDILICQLAEAGVEHVYLTLGYKAEMITEFIETMNYTLQITLVHEDTPLGTAGGLKNAVGETMEDVIVLSGDNIFSFDLKKIYRSHVNSDADVSLVGTYREDPRDYGTVQTDADGRILSFVEKPSWAQAESNIINTGIYILKGNIVSLIPQGIMYDFANDLFPRLMQEQYDLRCIFAIGEWGDLGDMTSYLQANREVLDGKFGVLIDADKLIKEDRILENGTVIKAPCSIGKNVVFGADCKIGPFCTIGNNCTIGDAAMIENTIIADGCDIGRHFYCFGAFIGENCKIDACVTVEENAVLAGYDAIGCYISVAGDCKMDPGCQIYDDAQSLNGNIKKVSKHPSLTASGIKAADLADFSLMDAFSVGASVACCKNVNRIGISCNGGNVADIYKRTIVIGIQAAGGTVYDFDVSFRCRRVFYSDYCNLDFFVYVEHAENGISLSFCAKGGCPISRATERALIANFRYNTFPSLKGVQCKDIFFMQPISSLYNSLFIHQLPPADGRFNVAVACDDRTIYELFCKALHEKGYNYNYGGLLFIIDKYGEKFYVIENEHAYSYDRILSICCQYAFEAGKNVAVGESAPGILEHLAEKYKCKLHRLYEAEREATAEEMAVLAENPWVFDGLLCIAQLLHIMQRTKKSLQQLSDALPECYVKNFSVPYDGLPKTFRQNLRNSGALRSQNRDGYYEWEDERGTIRVKSDAACKNIKILIEADSIELSRELSADAEEKIQNCAIDKFC
ncbi:MAG: NTP transferase domain-containing protein [Clostridia bacterium]|nr:NTP transferase domain-containing protein [Clostridia bacterium]